MIRRVRFPGHPIAAIVLGAMIAGVAARPPAWAGDGVAALRTPAEQGNAAAQNNLGTLYDHGEDVPQDYATAATWYRLAAKQGDAEAQDNIGGLYDLGHCVPQDYARAAHWFDLAAARGDAWAQANLGVLYAQGHGVPHAQTSTPGVRVCSATSVGDTRDSQPRQKTPPDAGFHAASRDAGPLGQQPAQVWPSTNPASHQPDVDSVYSVPWIPMARSAPKQAPASLRSATK